MMKKLQTRMKLGRQGWQRSLPLGEDGVCQVCIVGLGATSHVLLGMFGLMDDGAPIRLNLLNTCPKTSTLQLQASFKEHGGVVLHHLNDQDRQKVHLAFPDSILPGKHGVPSKISNDPADVIPGCQMVLFAQSTEEDRDILFRINDHLADEVWLGHFATRGFEDAVLLRTVKPRRKMTLFGLSDCPWLSEIKEPGRSVNIFGTYREVAVACRPNRNKSAVATVVQGIIDPSHELCKVGTGYSFLGVSLGAVGFTTVFLEAAQRHWKQLQGEEPVLKNFVDQAACSKLMELSSEVQLVSKALGERYPKLDLHGSTHIIDWWQQKFNEQARDPATFARMLQRNPTFADLRLKELKSTSGGEIDFEGGFLKEEVCNSLMPIKGIAEFLGLETPKLDSLIAWGQKRLGQEYLVQSRGPAAETQNLPVQPSSPTESKRPVSTSERGRLVCAGRDMRDTRAPQAFGAKTLEDFLISHFYMPPREVK